MSLNSRRVGVASRVLLVASVGVIAVLVPPWGDFQGHTHWAKVGWIPFYSWPVRLRDIVANVLLFAPFGAALSMNLRRSRIVTIAVFLGSLVSLVGEATQLYSHTRFPSATDLVCNSVGSGLGAWLMSSGRSKKMMRAADQPQRRKSA